MTKKVHWTQTPEGRARAAELAKKGWETRRLKKTALASGDSISDVKTSLQARAAVLNRNIAKFLREHRVPDAVVRGALDIAKGTVEKGHILGPRVGRDTQERIRRLVRQKGDRCVVSWGTREGKPVYKVWSWDGFVARSESMKDVRRRGLGHTGRPSEPAPTGN